VLVEVADLTGTLQRFEAAGVRAVPMAGKVRLMTHADISDADIATALRRIGPIDGATAGNDGRRSPVRPGRR
jgi:threonine aldolase